MPDEHEGTFGYGHVWTWMAIDADTKLVPSWVVGERTTEDCCLFLADLLPAATRPAHPAHHRRVRLPPARRGRTLAWQHRLRADHQGVDQPPPEDQRRYSPATCKVTDINIMNGDPDSEHELRRAAEPDDADGERRFTRLTNGFSKKVENLAHAVSFHYVHYNFGRPHLSLKGTSVAGASLLRWRQVSRCTRGARARSPDCSIDPKRSGLSRYVTHHGRFLDRSDPGD